MMPYFKKILRRAAASAALLALLAGAGVLALRAALPDTFSVAPGSTLVIASLPFIRAEPASSPAAAPVQAIEEDKSQNQVLTVLGVPVKTVRTVQQARRTVVPGGTAFGVKMFTDGALVVAFSDIQTVLGSQNPAKQAGLRLGDRITQAGSAQVRTNEELSAAVAASGGKELRIAYLRDGQAHTCVLTPALDRDTGTYRAGIWVRDSSAGIGTLTFRDPLHGTFAGLGHAVSDSDTGADLTLLTGEAVPVVVTGCRRGSAGTPGELKGVFDGAAFGSIKANDPTGIYGILADSAVKGEAVPVANIQEVHTGSAEIIAEVDSGGAQRYDVRIERVSMTAADPNRNLLLRVTDPDLLEKTGGIVQGMSGSPIIQDGMLVGAVTHVLVNDPTRGYGIFAATMLEHADSTA